MLYPLSYEAANGTLEERSAREGAGIAALYVGPGSASVVKRRHKTGSLATRIRAMCWSITAC